MHFLRRCFALILALLCFIPSALSENTPSLPIDFSPGMPIDPANYLSATEYSDPTLQVTIEKGNKDNCDYWIARVKIGHPSQLRTVSAGGFSEDFVTKAEYMARRQNAVLAINGDYYAYYRYGYILRQGKEYLTKLQGERDVLAIDENGDFHVVYVPARGTMTDTIDGKKLINVFHFGPVLVDNGEIGTLEASYWLAPEAKRQRMCIAQVGPLEYFCLCSAGPLRGSEGMTLQQFAELAKELGAKVAYNLDGGDTTTMIFNKKKINDVENNNTREISDIIYFASAWDGKKAD